MKTFYRRYILVVMVFGVALSLLAYFVIDIGQRGRVMHHLSRDVDRELSLFAEFFDQVQVGVSYLTRLHSISEPESATEFRDNAGELLARSRWIAALAWAPKIDAAARPRAEQTRALEIPGFEIRELTAGELGRAADRSNYFPIYYLEALAANTLQLGFDLTAARDRRELLLRSAASGSMVLQSLPQRDEIWLYSPVYPADTIETDRVRHHKGFIVAVIKISGIVEQSFIRANEEGIQISLSDITQADPQVLYLMPVHGQLLSERKYQARIPEVGGRQWQIEAIPTSVYLASHRTVMAITVLLFGVAGTLLAVIYMVLISRRETEIRKIVDERTRELHAANQKLELMTLTDALTGVVNRRGLDRVLEVEWSRAVREQIPLTLMIIDVDYFKHYNDHYGHVAGDECLKRVATAIAGVPRRLGDLVARYGGEEFAVMLPNTEDTEAVVAEKCKKAVESLGMKHEYSPISDIITVSIGVATLWPKQGSVCQSLIEAADEAMYRAKAEGRNRVVIAGTSKSAGATANESAGGDTDEEVKG